MKDKRSFYFGYGDGGHFLRGHTGMKTLDPQRDVPGFPWTIDLLDGGLLRNGKQQDHPDGQVHWTVGRDSDGETIWHAFYWWDRSGDARGASNSGFYVRGFAMDDKEAAFLFACVSWPDIIARQKHALTLVL